MCPSCPANHGWTMLLMLLVWGGAEEAYLRGSWLYFGLLRPTGVFLPLFENPASTVTVPSSTTCLLSSWPLPGQRKERKGVARDVHTKKTFNKSSQLCFLHCVHLNTRETRIFSVQHTTGTSCSCTVYINCVSLLKGKLRVHKQLLSQ